MLPSRLGLMLALALGGGCDRKSASPPGDAEAPAATPEPSSAPKVAAASAETPPADEGDPPKVEAADAVPPNAEANDEGTPESADDSSETTPGDGDADVADPEVAVPDATEGDTAEAPEQTILILGSSLAKTAFGSMLETTLDEHPQVDCHRFAKSATGLSRPDFFDWTATATREIEKHEPDAIVVVMGGNDGQDLRVTKGRSRVEWGSDGWDAAYRERVDEFVTLLAGDDRQVLWLGIPRSNTTHLEGKLTTIRAVHRAGVEAHPRATYIDPTPLIEDEDGALRRTIAVRGKTRTVRGDDGVHFTMAGSRFLADGVAPQILVAIGIAEPE